MNGRVEFQLIKMGKKGIPIIWLRLKGSWILMLHDAKGGIFDNKERWKGLGIFRLKKMGRGDSLNQ